MKRVESSSLPVVALTHPGMKGKNNEDRYAVSAFYTEDQPPVPVLLAILSDGIGGHRAGEVASEMAVNMISQYVADSDGKNPPRILQEAIHQASHAIHMQAQENVEQQGMGATCACAWIAGDRLYTATVGDSRIYLMRGDHITQLSIDHTWLQEALERGLIQPDQMNGHPNAHVIRRYLGSPTAPEVDFRLQLSADESDTQSVNNQGLRLLPDDRLLLCSDGLTDLVKADEILGTFLSMPLQESGEFLINLANQRGGHDNITLIGVHIHPAQTEPAPTMPVKTTAAAARAPAFLARSFVLGCLGVILLGVLVGSVLGGYFLYFRSTPTPTPGTGTAGTAGATITATLPGSTPGVRGTVTPTLPPVRTATTFRLVSPTPAASRQVTATPRPALTVTPITVNSPTLTSPPLPVVTLASP